MVYRKGEGWSYAQEKPAEDVDGPSNLPLGIMDSSSYDQFAVKLRVGDLVLCYTDGLPESRRPDGEFLGQDGLLEVIQSIPVADPSRIVPDFLAAISRLYEGNLAGDDITILLFRPNGVGLKNPFVNRVLAPFRVGKALIASLFPGGGPAPWPDRHPANIGGAVFGGLNKLWHGGGGKARKQSDISG